MGSAGYSLLFTIAGMHPLVPFLLGEFHPLGRRLVDFQKCIRTIAIDEVGDASHLTFFEMLGNWSLGDYFKAESLAWSLEFLTRHLNIPIEQLAEVEQIVNAQIQADLPVSLQIMTLDEAVASGALAFFGEKYGERVKVYSIGGFSKEVCGGPHVAHTGVLGQFQIQKEESVGQGKRRIRANLVQSVR